MQRKPFKLFFLLSILLVWMTGNVGKAAPNASSILLESADSLFAQGKYTEAFEIYEDIFHQTQRFSPKMLLKMAYVQEALGDYTQTLYYLNLYYLHSGDQKTLQKMEELAEAHELEGYQLTDAERFVAFYYKNFLEINIGAFVVLLLMLASIIRNRLRKFDISLPIIGLATVMVLFFYLNNYVINARRGIISNNNSLLMAAPSAGSDLVDQVNKGHRVKILDKQDIWYKVDFGGQEAFIRENNVMVIN